VTYLNANGDLTAGLFGHTEISFPHLHLRIVGPV